MHTDNINQNGVALLNGMFVVGLYLARNVDQLFLGLIPQYTLYGVSFFKAIVFY